MPRLEARRVSMFSERGRAGWNSAREDAQAGIPPGSLCFVRGDG